MAVHMWKTLGTHAGSKLALHAGVSLWIFLCYYPPQTFSVREPHVLAADLLPFQPWWAVVYQSVLLLHTAAIWCTRDARLSWLYVREVGLAFVAGAAVFWVWPTRVVRPDHDSWCYEWLITRVDGPGNLFPSLHAAMGLLGVLHMNRHWPAWRSSLWCWLGLLLVSTLFTHQHVWQDLMAGMILACTIHLLSNRHSS